MQMYVTCMYTANACQKMFSSSQRKEKSAKVCLTASIQYLQLIYNIPTRWNLAYTMLEWALHMHRAITLYLTEECDLVYWTLSNMEWDQCGALLTILYSFKVESTWIQQTDCPMIQRVYWSYERMFNTIDELRDNLQTSLVWSRWKDKDRIYQLLNAVHEMEQKLKSYYTAAIQYVFSEVYLLDLTTKTSLFESGSFIEDLVNWKQQYTNTTREWVQRHYVNVEIGDTRNFTSVVIIPAKHLWNDDNDNDNEFRRRSVDRQAQRLENEFDWYMQLLLEYDSGPLESWRKNKDNFPHLASMFRDVYAVSASRAGVQCEFSKSSSVAS